MSLPAIYRLIERGEIGSLRIGERSVRVPLSAVEQYEQTHTV
ncbi:MAG: excisionase family DNA-binding protein [Candidatus Eremiobacteraeota bacterium]|nr:excisionase family DNA-binding protein [Candidatus Eremiobacteraeota bacterium]MBC5802446.1 excisionase family DNA-binding protein [Candidatus Eremiobacteraeota bacterium]MBC5822900.1 excisionase family DNA-binding protein [Candidatus Eremiobacteraeota bacterium]